MNLYLVSRTDGIGYDEFDSCVVAAEDEECARRVYPQYNGSDYARNEIFDEERQVWESKGTHSSYTQHSWAPPKTLEVKLIGVADPGLKSGCVCASFNAG